MRFAQLYAEVEEGAASLPFRGPFVQFVQWIIQITNVQLLSPELQVVEVDAERTMERTPMRWGCVGDAAAASGGSMMACGGRGGPVASRAPHRTQAGAWQSRTALPRGSTPRASCQQPFNVAYISSRAWALGRASG
jgi:hypothetical protein